jgi:hypothetical protein
MSRWMERLKSLQAPDSGATKTTETLSVVSVAYLPATLEISRVSAAPIAEAVPRWTTDPANDSPESELDPDRWCWPHSDSMNGAELSTFVVRTKRFVLRGSSIDDAEALADRLVLRDRQQDDRRMCLECRNHRPGRCGNHRTAGLHSPELGSDLAELLQRCAGFQTVN